MSEIAFMYYFDPLRDDPRFQAILRSMNFPSLPAAI